MIRPLHQDDRQAVMNIWLGSNLQAHSFISEEYWRSHVPAVWDAMQQAQVLVFEQDGEILGFIGWVENYIAGLFVADSARSQGVGKQLLDQCKQLSSQLWLQVYDRNDGAIRFYQREGFSLEKEQLDKETGEKEWIMCWMSV